MKLFWQCLNCCKTPRCEDGVQLGDERDCPFCGGEAFAAEDDPDDEDYDSCLPRARREKNRADKAEADKARCESLLQTEQRLSDNINAELAATKERVRRLIADLRDTETLCSRLQARVHLLEQLNAELQASEIGQLQARLTAAMQGKDKAEAERDDARRELVLRSGPLPPAQTHRDEADRSWPGEGKRLFPEGE